MQRKLFRGGNYPRAETICGNTALMIFVKKVKLKMFNIASFFSVLFHLCIQANSEENAKLLSDKNRKQDKYIVHVILTKVTKIYVWPK